MRTRGEVLGESSDFFGAEVDEQTLRQNQDSVGAAVEIRKQRPPGADVRQIHSNALERASRLLVRKNSFFVSKNFRQIHFDPWERRRQRHTIGPSVETCRKIDHHVRALLDLLRDELIEKISPCYPRPRVTVSLRQCVGNIYAHLSGKAFGVGIAEERVCPLGLARAKDGRPSGRIRNVSNDGLRAGRLNLRHSPGPFGRDRWRVTARKMVLVWQRSGRVCWKVWIARRRRSNHLQRPQPGCAAYSAGVSMFRRKNRRVRFLAENVLLQTGRNILVKPWNLRSPPAHHNHVRIKKIDDLRQTAREPVFKSIERGERGRFACGASRDDLGALERN